LSGFNGDEERKNIFRKKEKKVLHQRYKYQQYTLQALSLLQMQPEATLAAQITMSQYTRQYRANEVKLSTKKHIEMRVEIL